MYDNEVIEYAREQENIISKLEYRVHEYDDGRVWKWHKLLALLLTTSSCSIRL